MFRGLYTATSSMQVSERKMDVTSNNMANVNTTGFKRDTMISESFPEVLLHKINGELPNRALGRDQTVEVEMENGVVTLSTEGDFFSVEGELGRSYNRSVQFTVDEEGHLRTFSRRPNGELNTANGNYILNQNGARIQIEGMTPENMEIDEQGQLFVNGDLQDSLIQPRNPNVIGTINSGLRLDKVETNFLQGGLENTESPMHMALDGEGFFVITTEEGETLYTRDGGFTLNNEGQLVTTEGHLVQGEEGPITPGAQEFLIGEEGQVMIGDAVVNQLSLVNIENPEFLEKFQDNYYRMNEAEDPELAAFEGKVLQGYLEGSNVNTVREMAEMIANFRNFESNQKVVSAYDELLQRAVNDIAR
ncbi:flagellar hook-basal body protein [Isachenkonia alkalipeptolytica]|uniref:Flagellar hook-basal body complex protein n=1 Tax=Isachenkonia alkalipeptolytica TaxID=2565777 RepID=A0AA43XKE0_9CLOT|nr:flagellar hook-basal body complex protein [Isachenkonia alkalipeptolytica]NBG88322.1 flagellar hook-basal body complex protein [Isachenkonia alkalipeptolytica]